MMNSGDKSTGSSSSSRGNGGKNKKTKQDFPREPQRGMGVAKLERIRLSALNKGPYHQELDMMGQAAAYDSVYQASPQLYPFGYHVQPNTMVNFGGLGGGSSSMKTAAHSNPQPSRSYASSIDSNCIARAAQQQRLHFAQPTSSPPTRERHIELDLLGKRQRREEGAPSGDEEIDLELKL